MQNKKILYGLMVFQILIIAGMLLKAVYPLWAGQEVELRVTPKDPRDIFRGNYVALNYDFNSINLDSVSTDIPDSALFNYGDELFVELKKKGQFYITAGVWMSPPENDVIYLKAITEKSYSSKRVVRLNCGIESYFTDPKMAKEWESRISSGNTDRTTLVTASVMVTGSGAARIKGLNLVDTALGK